MCSSDLIGKMGSRVMSVGIAASFQKMVHGMICAQIRAFRPDNVPIVPWRRKLASGKPSQKIKKPGFNPGLTRSELDHLQEVVAGLEGRWRQQIKGGFHQNPACLPVHAYGTDIFCLKTLFQFLYAD